MIEYLVGKVVQVKDKDIILLVNGFGFKVQIAQPKSFESGKSLELHAYMHWNQEKGPSLFGFKEKLDRTVFLLIIDCHKVGPQIAMSILNQMTAGQFLQVVSSQDSNALSKVNGIGAKKAEQIILQLRDKVSKVLISGEIESDGQQGFNQWQNVNDVLESLNYSRPEISNTIKFLTEKYSGQNVSLDKLIRSALSFLSGNI